MASPRKTPWQTVQRLAENLVFNEAPRLIRQLEQAPLVQQRIQRGIEQGIKIGLEILSGAAPDESPAIPTGRPVTDSSVPTAHRARRLVYAPDLNGRADPGEIVWTWVAYEDDPGQGKDRPVLVVGRDHTTLLGLMLSSQARHQDDANWVGIGAGSWDEAHRVSWVRLDRVLDVPEESIRREGAILERTVFEVVASRLRSDYAWS
ncbi:type II toxin-antitoxin system PemK/MazF family toxin [[Mycobacterium] nativiensis]|uniref:Type II toxin-antitoxin system PemK/MazF family toxin n=1 Tax=[Mycobacterium] nativiensis TaxID=2855503 RepID=A0ABU5Y276_9MYCO|nr:type II toxin-antitoxin system PemK/MazF family toxin [Mycolicibacter sp. MYC340]MEB3034320.1 type II toxin-antitoxin system PemK/MazF family toxin [Mycolicibacter sp. MYC340]